MQSDGLRLRKLALSDTVSSTPSQSKLDLSPRVPPPNPPFVIPVAAYLVAVLLLGVIIGKLVL